MLAFLTSFAAVAVGQAAPDFAQVNTFENVRLELPLTAAPDANAGTFSGSGGGVDFRLTVNRTATPKAVPVKQSDATAARLKALPGMKAYRGGSVLPIKLGRARGWLLRMNFETSDNRELAIDELLVPVQLDVYDFVLTAERHDPKAMAWLSRSFASLRASVSGDKAAKLDAFTADGLAWQSWKSGAAHLAMLVPHTPFVSSNTPTDAEVSHREGSYADVRYGIKFVIQELKTAPSQSVADVLRQDLSVFALPDGQLTKPEVGKSRTIDGAPASVADCALETSSGTTKIVLLDVLKDRWLYRITLSAPAGDAGAVRNLDRVIESIRLSGTAASLPRRQP